MHPHTQNLVPMLLVHHVKTKSRSSAKSKGSLFSMPFGQSPADFLDIAEPISNPIPLSTGPNENLASVDIVDGILLTECACGAESGCMPEVGQIVPLAGGSLLAVTCTTMDDKSGKCSVLLLFKVSAEGKLEAECVSSVLMSSLECSICPVTETPRPDRNLLACVSTKGEVCLYNCAGGWLERLSGVQCSVGQEGELVTSCAYCPTTARFFVSLSSGKILSVKFTDQEKPTVEQSADALQQNVLDSSDFDGVLSLVAVSPVGVPFSCSSSVHWKEISLLWYNRRSPLHMNVAPQYAESKSQHRKGNVDNCRILQYEPTLEPTSDRSVRLSIVCTCQFVRLLVTDL